MAKEEAKSSEGEGDSPAADSAASSAFADDEQVAVRRGKLAELRQGGRPFPNDFKPDASCRELVLRFGDTSADDLEADSSNYCLAGRVTAIRSFGKTTFLKLVDETGALQLYTQRQGLGEEVYGAVKKLDIGDVVGVCGTLFRTRTDELTLKCESFRLLVKSLRPLPEKWHGLTDKETRYRRRYVDLIVNEGVRDTFRKRAAIVAGLRDFLTQRGYLEVETPMMQPVAGGAAARPFATHHNALSMDMYLRIAPELYLKRLVVGGFERVFELNRNFRNEGISLQHNPEFTMLEFYQAYATYEDLMVLTEELVETLAADVCGSTTVTYEGEDLNLAAPYTRLNMAEAVADAAGLSAEAVLVRSELDAVADRLEIDSAKRTPGLGLLVDLFEHMMESELRQPTFVTGFPVEVSPLARQNTDDPRFVDRFELFIAGREIANGFSELNDPEEQRKRFSQQLERREAGDLEAHMMDDDYVRALEYGLPPTAGEGIGVDRLVMILTGTTSIRDVVLFPHLKPESRD